MHTPRHTLFCCAITLALLTVVASAATADDVRRAYVDSRVGQLHLRSIGDAANGSGANLPLVLLHQVPNSSQVFEAFMPLIARDRRAVAFDLPGFGMSDPVTGGETIGAYADAIIDGIDYLALDRIDLLGYHTGAAVAVEIIRKRPDLVRCVVLAAVPVLTAEERAHFAALPPIPFDEAGDFAKLEWQRSMQWRGPGQTTDSVKRTYAEKMRPGARERGAQAVIAYDLAAVLSDIEHPMLVLRPKDDLWEATLRARPFVGHASWIELPDYGHGVFDAAPAMLAELISEFLDQPEP